MAKRKKKKQAAAAASEPAKQTGMSEADFQKLVTDRCTEAVDYIEGSIALEREMATDYYHGRLPDIDQDTDEEDRSTAVLTEVRDTTLGMLPDLMRIFFSGDGVCEYRPVPTDNHDEFKQREKYARDATRFVQHEVIERDNPDYFFTFHAAFQDALVRKKGFIKYWWQRSKKPEYCTYTGLTQEQVLTIVGEDDEITAKRAYQIPGVEGIVTLFDISLKRIKDYGCVRLQALPCENFFVSRKGRNLDDAPVLGYSEEKTVSDFVEMGFSEADLADCDAEAKDEDNPEAMARDVTTSGGIGDVTGEDDEPVEDPTQRKVKYTEAYVLADKDGDKIAELVRVICAGTKYKVLESEPVDDVQLAAFGCYPEAHQFFDLSVADLTMDVQRISSRVMRDVLDSLAQSVTPQTAVVEGKVNLDDVLNPDTSKVVRQQAPGMITPLITEFVGKEGLPILDVMKNVREARTGMTDAAQGLDPKVLQSTDKDAVGSTLSKAQGRIEMVARVLAEGGMKRLFRGVLKLLVKHQDTVRHFEGNGGALVAAYPSQWSPDMTVRVVIPLGRGSTEQQVGFLTGVAAKQEQIMQVFGPENPFCGLTHYRYTLGKILELASWANTESFFGDPASFTPEQVNALKQAMAAQAAGGQQQAGPTVDPQVEMAKIASNEKIKGLEIQHKRDELAVEAQIAMAKLQAETNVKIFVAQLERQTTLDEAQVDAAVKRSSDMIKSQTAVIVEQLKPRGGADKGAGSE